MAEDYLKKIIFYFMTASKTRPRDTTKFIKMEHNKHLCPKVEEQLNEILGYFLQYRSISYDIQGFRDAGTDVLLRYYVDGEPQFICFQIKSHDDLKQKDYMKVIKAQYLDSDTKYKMVDYYLLLATDETSEKDKIRTIKSELAKVGKCTVIDPSYFLFFLSIDNSQMGAVIKSYLHEGDILISHSMSILKGLFRSQYMLIFTMIDSVARKGFEPIKIDDIVYNNSLKEEYDKQIKDNRRKRKKAEDDIYDYDYALYESKDYEAMIYQDLDVLSEIYFSVDYENKLIHPDMKYLKSILALVLEAQFRYNYESEEMVKYMEGIIYGRFI
jgi:hypothetical protein